MSEEISKHAENILNFVNEVKKNKALMNNIKDPKQAADVKSKINVLFRNIKNESSQIFNIVKIDANNIQKPAQSAIPIPVPRPVQNVPQPVRVPSVPLSVPQPEQKAKTFQPEIPKPQSAQASSVAFPQPEIKSEIFRRLTKEEKKKYLKDLNIGYDELEDFVKQHTSKKKIKVELKKPDYSIYRPSEVGAFANKIMKKKADILVKKYPKLFKPLFDKFLMVEMEMISRSYVSLMLLFTVLSFPFLILFFLALNFAFNLNFVTILVIAILGTVCTFVGFYFYPASLLGGKSKKIKLELPFALVHMSAVAGSGAQPISIFELIAESSEYPELRKEIKKILNYINLFGYNLTNALKNVAAATPSLELKELLNGMISTIETGGDLKDYLKEKAVDTLNTYKLDRKKQVEALATYSEVYTALLIASPLLLLITLAIINSIGGKIAGLPVTTAAWIGILGFLPLLNIGFMVFVTSSQKGI